MFLLFALYVQSSFLWFSLHGEDVEGVGAAGLVAGIPVYAHHHVALLGDAGCLGVRQCLEQDGVSLHGGEGGRGEGG